MTEFTTESGSVYTYDGEYLIRKGAADNPGLDYSNSPDETPLPAVLMGEIEIGYPAVFHLTGIENHPYRMRVTNFVTEVDTP